MQPPCFLTLACFPGPGPGLLSRLWSWLAFPALVLACFSGMAPPEIKNLRFRRRIFKTLYIAASAVSILLDEKPILMCSIQALLVKPSIQTSKSLYLDGLHPDTSARTLHPDRQEALSGWTPSGHFCPDPPSRQARSFIWVDSSQILKPDKHLLHPSYF